MRSEITAFMNSPMRKTLLLISKVMPEKSGYPPIAAIKGVMRSSTSEVMRTAKARPITTATARSTRFPLRRKSLNSLIMLSTLHFSPAPGDSQDKAKLVACTCQHACVRPPENLSGAGFRYVALLAGQLLHGFDEVAHAPVAGEAAVAVDERIEEPARLV